MPELSKTTIAWHTVRIIIIGRLCRTIHKILLQRAKKWLSFPKMLVVLALLLGFVAYRLIQSIINVVLCTVMPLKTMLPFDEFFLYDTKEAASTVGILIGFKNAKFDDMKKWIKEKCLVLP